MDAPKKTSTDRYCVTREQFERVQTIASESLRRLSLADMPLEPVNWACLRVTAVQAIIDLDAGLGWLVHVAEADPAAYNLHHHLADAIAAAGITGPVLVISEW